MAPSRQQTSCVHRRITGEDTHVYSSWRSGFWLAGNRSQLWRSSILSRLQDTRSLCISCWIGCTTLRSPLRPSHPSSSRHWHPFCWTRKYCVRLGVQTHCRFLQVVNKDSFPYSLVQIPAAMFKHSPVAPKAALLVMGAVVLGVEEQECG